MEAEIYKCYRALGAAILFEVCKEYNYVYRRYLRGHTSRTYYDREKEYMHNDFTVVLIHEILQDTPEGLMRNLERRVQEEMEGGECTV